MCGIAGQVRGDGRAVDAALLESMCARIEHRGPDARGTHLEGPAGLGIQRLRVIDIDTGDQPIYNEDRSVAVVLNGEIYNFRELRERLRAGGHTFATSGDTETIVHLYEEEGPDCVRSLEGMFAFALWDARRRKLLLARDRLGKKPLFYSHRGGTLTFASELNALMQDPEIPRELDLAALDCYLAYGYVPAPLSAFRAVRKLPPATTLELRDGAAELRPYWRLDYSAKLDCDEHEALERLREEIRRAVRCRMVADVPLGAFLSGGIDSSTVVATMAEASSEPVRTFSIGFATGDERFNELPRARTIAERFGTEHHEFVIEPKAIEMLPEVVDRYGEPFADSSAIPSLYLAELARRHVTVALNGDGGDESFGGYSRYAANLLLDRLDRVPRSLRRAAGAVGRRLPASGRIDSTLSRLRRLALTLPLAPGERYFAYSSHLDGLVREDLYTPELWERIDAARAGRFVTDAWAETSGTSVLERMLEVDVRTYLPGDLLVKMDVATMAHSLEARSPLLDHRLMEFAASLPPELKVNGTEKKIGLRRTMRGTLPDEILDGRKQGFEVPLAEWLRGDLRELVGDVLLSERALARGYFRPDRVRALVDQHVAGTRDNSRGLWTLLVFELWHQRVADAPALTQARAPAG
ncbi:MAG: asparagine synthase (glutamine-hydrolyzing), partial [Thermoleophilaceae bacterium]